VRRKGKAAFLRTLPRNARLLDVGCGNDSPRRFKAERPDIWYIGLDIQDYNQSAPQFANEYVVVDAGAFASTIEQFDCQLDAVVSAHNLEHCSEPQDVLKAMLRALRPGGRIYLSFPCEKSTSFPRRRGTLNFFDDATHVAPPPWDSVLSTIEREGLSLDFAAKRYRSPIMWLIGLVVEPASAVRSLVMPGTWDLYGFESVIWASRPPSASMTSFRRRRRYRVPV
jgi:SAM-dependent methyltransferase